MPKLRPSTASGPNKFVPLKFPVPKKPNPADEMPFVAPPGAPPMAPAYAHSPPTLSPVPHPAGTVAPINVSPLVTAENGVNDPQPVQLKNTAVRRSAGTRA